LYVPRILVIDDDEQIRELLTYYLHAKGYEASTAPDGNRGLKAFQNEPADLVIVDLIMPEKEGLETIQELKALEPHVKIIAISGGMRGGTLDFLPAALQLGAMKIFPKPFDIDALGEAIRELLSSGPHCLTDRETDRLEPR
jgi:DNA-binding response OmpR family regulator